MIRTLKLEDLHAHNQPEIETAMQYIREFINNCMDPGQRLEIKLETIE